MFQIKKYFFVFVITVIFPFTACAEEAVPQTSDNTAVIETADGQKIPFAVELALTDEEMAQGLMFREELAPQSGMLFVFPSERFQRFWMKNTLIPLDMLFITADGTIHHIHPMAQPMDTSRISSQGAVKAVLEINGGESAALGIKPGDRVLHPLLEGPINVAE